MPRPSLRALSRRGQQAKWRANAADGARLDTLAEPLHSIRRFHVVLVTESAKTGASTVEKTWSCYSISRREPINAASAAAIDGCILVIGGHSKASGSLRISAPGIPLYPIHCLVPLTSWQHPAAGTYVESGANIWLRRRGLAISSAVPQRPTRVTGNSQSGSSLTLSRKLPFRRHPHPRSPNHSITL